MIGGCASQRTQVAPKPSNSNRAAQELAVPSVSATRPASTIVPVHYVESQNGDPSTLPTPRNAPADSGAVIAENIATPLPPANALRDSDQYPLDLSTAIKLAGDQNPMIALAQEQIRQAMAIQEAAETLWLPSIHAGASWNRHEGTLQDTSGNIIESNRNSLYTGLGNGAVGAGSPVVPGLQANFNLAEALYRPLAARQRREARQAAAAAVFNNTLLQVCQGYLELLRASQDSVISVESYKHTKQLVDLTGKYASAGQGLKSDADRMQAELALRENDIQRAEETSAVASARLNELLGLEPGIQLKPVEKVVAPWNLVNVDTPLACLIDRGYRNRPELTESRALIEEARQNLHREEASWKLPHVAVGASYGGFGGGMAGSITDFSDRVDFDAGAYWELRNLGFGDESARRAAQSEVGIASLRRSIVTDRVVREIAEAYAQVRARGRQIATARQGILAAQTSYQANLTRIQNVQGLPIETLQAIQALTGAQREYLRAVIDYNTAQFALLRAVGWRLCEVDLESAAHR